MEGAQAAEWDRRKQQELYALLKRRGFVWPSFEIYGGVAGFYDLGPLGSVLKDNIESAWKRTFLVEEGFMQVDCPSISPETVFRFSGHLEKFSDLMTRCVSCSTPFRADHLLSDAGIDLNGLTAKVVGDHLTEKDVRCPSCGGVLGPVEEFNLMFKTHIGPGTDRPAYLRPETAQSIFMDFSMLYRANRERVPFGVAQLGKGFRNEISPRQGLLRQREFHMAEGEFFFDPLERTFPPFSTHRDRSVPLVRASDPDRTVEMPLGSAVKDGTICSEVLAHFMGVTHRFVISIGIPGAAIRFRQHGKEEMAHYARDCWDLEVLTSSGWVEMVGIADRSAYDLSQHAKGSGSDLTALRRFSAPVTKEVIKVRTDKKVLGPLFKARAKEVDEVLCSTGPDELRRIHPSGTIHLVLKDGSAADVPSSAVSFDTVTETVQGERYTPHVVEPSFGIDRLMVAVLEHSYVETASSPMKEAEKDEAEDAGPYRVMRFLPSVAPIKCGVFPLLPKDGLPDLALKLSSELRSMGVSVHYDASGSIGRRYARMDEVGTPFGLTVDHTTLEDGTVTIRERDSGEQRRILSSDAARRVLDLAQGSTSFSDL